MLSVFFFFKQKTAYEMRIRDWSSDVCSSDLAARTARDWTRAEVVRDPLLYMLLSGTLAPSFIATVIFFHQGYLIDLRGYDPLVFAAAFPVMAVTTIMFGLVCGHLIDRLDRKSTRLNSSH